MNKVAQDKADQKQAEDVIAEDDQSTEENINGDEEENETESSNSISHQHVDDAAVEDIESVINEEKKVDAEAEDLSNDVKNGEHHESGDGSMADNSNGQGIIHLTCTEHWTGKHILYISLTGDLARRNSNLTVL